MTLISILEYFNRQNSICHQQVPAFQVFGSREVNLLLLLETKYLNLLCQIMKGQFLGPLDYSWSSFFKAVKLIRLYSVYTMYCCILTFYTSGAALYL